MRKFLSIFICIMSCFLLVGCSSSSKMDGNWIYDHYEAKNVPSNIRDITFSNSIVDSLTIKNGYILYNVSSSKIKLEKAQFENGIQYYISGIDFMGIPVYLYYNEADDTVVLVISNGNDWPYTSEFIFKRK